MCAEAFSEAFRKGVGWAFKASLSRWARGRRPPSTRHDAFLPRGAMRKKVDARIRTLIENGVKLCVADPNPSVRVAAHSFLMPSVPRPQAPPLALCGGG